MNRRAFLGATSALVTFGWTVRAAGPDPVRFGDDEPPSGFPESNWIDFPDRIGGIVPSHDYHLVSCSDAIFRLDHCGGPFAIRGPVRQRLWCTHLNTDLARVTLWYSHALISPLRDRFA